MAPKSTRKKAADIERYAEGAARLPLYQLDIVEVTGHNLEARGREQVNRLLEQGWVLLHIYTLKYHEDDVWRERPMAILGRPRNSKRDGEPSSDDRGEPANRKVL